MDSTMELRFWVLPGVGLGFGVESICVPILAMRCELEVDWTSDYVGPRPGTCDEPSGGRGLKGIE